MASHQSGLQLVCSDVDDVVAAPERAWASATAQCVTGNPHPPHHHPQPCPWRQKGASSPRGEHCNRSWLVRPVKEKGTYPFVPCALAALDINLEWPVRSTACRLGASNLPAFNTATGTGAIERTCPPETSQIATAVDSLRPCTRNTHSTRPAFDPVRRNLSTRTTELTHLINFPGCTPPHSFPSTAVVPIIRLPTTTTISSSPHRPVPPPTERPAAPPSSLRAAPGQEWCIHGSPF